MAKDTAPVIDDEQSEIVDQETVETIEVKPVDTVKENHILRRQKERAEKLAAETKAENEKLRADRDAALARAETAEEVAKARAASDAELLKADTLADLGYSPSLREYIKSTAPEDIKAEVERLVARLGLTKQSPIQETEPTPEPEPEKPKPHTARPEPREAPTKPNLSKMTEQQKLEYFGDKLDDMQFGDDEE